MQPRMIFYFFELRDTTETYLSPRHDTKPQPVMELRFRNSAGLRNWNTL